MAISFACECGARYQVKDSYAGREVNCRKCGNTVTVPGGNAPGLPENTDPSDSVPMREAPRVLGHKRKKQRRKNGGGTANPLQEMTLDERIAARSRASETQRSLLVTIFTGDIRPILVGGASVLLGIAFVVCGFFAPGMIGEEAARERGLGEVMQMNRRERMGTSVLASIYETFGEAGLMLFLVIAGLGIMAGGVWYFLTHVNNPE